MSGWRGPVALLLLAAALGLIALGTAAAYSLAETYSGDWDVVTSVTAIVGLVSVALALLARRVARRERPSVPVTVATVLVLGAVAIIGGNLLGDARHVTPAEQMSGGG